MQTFTFQRSSKALSVHVNECNISVNSAVLRGVRPKPKQHARMERAAAAPRIKRRHSSPRVDRKRATHSCPWSASALRHLADPMKRGLFIGQLRPIVALVASLALTTEVSADAKIDFETAVARWRSQVVTAYSFTYQDQDGGVVAPRCGGTLVRVTVVQGKSQLTRVIRGTRHCRTGTRGEAIDVEVPSSIDTLFDRMRRWVYDPRPRWKST